MVTGKVFYVPAPGPLDSTSYHGGFRRYVRGDGVSYVGLTYSHGFSREEIRNLADLTTLDSDTLRAEIDQQFAGRLRVFATGGTSRQDRQNRGAAVADVAQRRIHGALLSLATIRLFGGAAVLALYAAVLQPARERRPDRHGRAAPSDGSPRAGPPTKPPATRTRCQPTIELTRALPNQQVYAERLALIYQHLGRPAEEAAAWERVAAASPTPIDACPALPDAYVRAAGLTDQALDAFERCAAFEPGNTDMLFFLGRARERSGRVEQAAGCLS